MTTDPDDKATAEAAATLQRMFGDRRHMVTDKEAKWITFCIVNRWIQARTHNWAVRRGTPKIGAPDAMMLGFAEAALPLIARELEKAGADLTLPVLKMAKTDATKMFAIGAEAIEASRVHTMEDPTMEEVAS